MTELRTRQEELWWDAPRIRHHREWVLGSNKRDSDWPLGGRGPLNVSFFNEMVLVLVFGKDGWETNPYFDRLDCFKLDRDCMRWRGMEWEKGAPVPAFDYMLHYSRDPRLMDPAEFNQADDSVKAHRLMCMAIDRLIQDEPEVPSVWWENGTLTVGWDPLPPEDGRKYEDASMYFDRKQVDQCSRRLRYNQLDEWRWRAARTDLRYDGDLPN